jgi:VCBS repeat-containing protein
MSGTSQGRGLRSRVVAVLAGGALAAALVGPPGVAAVDPAAGGPLARAIVLLDRQPNAADRQAVRTAGGTVRHAYTLIDAMAVEIPANAIPGLSRNPHVTSVELDATITTLEPLAAAESTGEYEYDNAWGVVHIGAKPVHDAGIWGQGVRVAVIDTGIDYVHDQPPALEPPVVDPEFNASYRGGYDFVNDDTDPMDDNGHGTHVAGILAAERNWYLVVGVAPQVDLYALKILAADGSGYESDLILALQWAVEHDMDVVNMSLGTHDVVPALQAAVESAAAAGLLMVAASGNTSTFQEIWYGCAVTYPGAYPQVLATTFTNPNNALTGYSCTGPEVDFASPGDNIFSPVPVGSCQNCSPNGYLPLSGTSMASPHLAGTVALLLGAGIADSGTPGLFDDVRSRLCATANVGYGVQTAFGSTPIPTTDPRYPKYFGCGVIDAEEAVLGLLPPPPTNRPPVAAADEASTSEDAAANVAVLANDIDPDLDDLSVTNVGDPAHGSASVNANGTVHYAPDADFAGDDSFTYTIADGRGGTSGATVTVHVAAVNDPPVATDDTASTAEDTAVDIAVLPNDSDVDGDALAVTSVFAAVNGTASVNANGTVHFAPNLDFFGAASFGYTISDGHSGSDNGAASVTVGAFNDPPVATNDSATTSQGTPVTVAVLANDTDVDSASLVVASVSDPPHGTVVANANGTITYAPDPGYSGPDAFGYSAGDGSATSNVATVSITVSPVPPANLLHVGDLDGSASASGKTWTAAVTIRVHDAAHGAVSGVRVTGSWSSGATGTAACTTGTNGACTVQKTKLSRASVASVTFTVTAAARSGWTYAPAANHEQDGDSTGTVIVVARPT